MTSRNQEHWRAWAEVASFLEDTALLLDREFCCEEDLGVLQRLRVQEVVRLNVGLNPTLSFEREDFSRKVSFSLQPGERRSYKGVWYKGVIRVNVAGCGTRRIGVGGKKWGSYSGLFILLKEEIHLSETEQV